ncbi:MAG: SDR family NAD(P)-dependent oxidoreductase [Bacteroidales bacterium]
MTEFKRFFNKVVLVTGAANGIGRSAVERFAREGAKVIIADHNFKKAKTFSIALATEGFEAKAFNFDAESLKSCDELVKFALNEYGRIDILVNNVGITDSLKDVDILNLDIAYFDKVFHTNLRSMIYLVKLVLPSMIKVGKGNIINISSVGSDIADLQYTFFGASKAGVKSLTKYIATQYAKYGIRCNGIAPGLVMTSKVQSILPPDIRDVFHKYDADYLIGESEDIASCIAFLASSDSKFMNGQTIVVDGGLSASNAITSGLMERFKLEQNMNNSEQQKVSLQIEMVD